MSRPHAMPLLALDPLGRVRGRPAKRSPARPSARALARITARRRAMTQVACVGMTISLDGGPGGRLADAVLRRVLGCGCPVGTVVLDLGPATELDSDGCAALLAVYQRLTAIGTRLRLAASTRGLLDSLAGTELLEQLGRDAVHPSFRAAVLATYAALPGPGLVMGRVKSALETQAELIEPLPARLDRAAEPARAGQGSSSSAASPPAGGAGQPGTAVDCPRQITPEGRASCLT
jgi:hypothetical protein